jgi:HNH endonuclease
MNLYLVHPNAVYYRINCEGQIIRNASCTINRKREFPEAPVQQSKGAHGYYTLTSRTWEGVQKLSKMHRLVAELFIPNPKGLLTVNHIDRDKSNNAASNLEWMTQRDNVKDAHDAGLVPYFSGLDHGNADRTSYLFIHKDGRRIVIATPFFMKDTFRLDSASLSRHLHATLNVQGNSVWTVGGWRAACLIDQRPKEIELDWDLIELPPQDASHAPFYVHPDFPMLRVSALGEVMQNGYCSVLGTRPTVNERHYKCHKSYNHLSVVDNSQCSSKTKKRTALSTIVAQLFVPGYAEGKVVRHIDGDKLNSKASNLMWGTKKEMMKEAIASGTAVLPSGIEARRADRKTYHFIHEDGTEFEGTRIDFKAFCLTRGVKISDGPLSSTVSGKVDNRGTVPYSVKGWRVAHFI